VNVGDGPNEGQDGLGHDVGVNGGGNRTRTTGSSTGSTVNIVTLAESTGEVALFDIKHRLTIDLLHKGETTTLVTRDGSARVAFAADLLPPDVPAASVPIGTPPRELRDRSTLLHMDVRNVRATARRVLPRGLRRVSTAFNYLAAFLNLRNLVSHPELFDTPIRPEFGIQAEGVSSTRSGLSVKGEMGETEIVGVVDQVTGKIIFGLSSAGVSWGGSSGTSVGTSAGGRVVHDDGGSTTGGSLSVGHSGGTSVSTSILDIWGTEELTIETGRQYILRADMLLHFDGTETHAGSVRTPQEGMTHGRRGTTSSAQGSALFAVPENDMLIMYADGELKLPLALVADAVERFRNGSLDLDRTLAVPLVQTYLKALTEARGRGTAPKLSAKHTPRALLMALKRVAGVTVPQGQDVDARLDAAQEETKADEDVVLAPQHENAMGLSTVDSFKVTDTDGERVNLLDAVMHAVNSVVPDAEQNAPGLREEVGVDLPGARSTIRIPDMLSSRGFTKTYHVHSGARSDRPEAVTVRVRLEPRAGADPRMGKLVGRKKQTGIILQRYRYTDQTHTESVNGSNSVGLDGSASDGISGGGVGVSTDLGHSYSDSTNEQGTRLTRIALWNGLDQVSQDMTLIIEVERRSARTRTLPGWFPVARAAAAIKAAVDRVRGRRRAASPQRFDATLVRNLQTGMSRPVAQDPGPVASVTDPRQVELHPGHFVETLRDAPDRPSLYDVVTGRLAKMLGRDTITERQAELESRLASSALITGFERMSGTDGDVVVRVARHRFKKQGADVTIKARLSDMTVVSGPFAAEKGEVDRKADAQNVSMSRGRALPLS
ncbi:hypothetical protein ACWEPC_52325, partial [Nonomuraea sp. NPDC004297]